uniref:Peptidase S1 domain-containing protein n=1 Tax=Mola mola TaxID=94237 RepID=A0A3Q3VVW8_MOLML
HSKTVLQYSAKQKKTPPPPNLKNKNHQIAPHTEFHLNLKPYGKVCQWSKVFLSVWFLDSSSCVHGMQCGDGSCVWESQWCDGVKDCPAGQDEDTCVRLHGSSFLLQIYSAKTWRTVCSRGWTEQHGRAKTLSLSSSNVFFGTLISTCANSTNRLHCTGERADMTGRASGRQLASLGAWPWQVSLQFVRSHRCGGAIISPYWTVTAAHCVARSSNPADWMVYAGIVDSSGTLFNPAYPVSRIIAHEGYNSQTKKNDIALIRLSNPLDITGDFRKSYVNTKGEQKNSSSLYLMEAQVSLIDTAECNRSTAYNGRISQDMFCARETEAAARMCSTDSGSPLVILKNGVWWLIGESVWGKHCTEQNPLNVYGNVTHFRNWIYQQMRVKNTFKYKYNYFCISIITYFLHDITHQSSS